MVKISHLIAVSVFVCTMVAYSIFLILGRKWRKEFESEGVKYWNAPKEERLKELIQDVWKPKRISSLYFMAYFAEGYIRTAITIWAPLFLLQVLKVSILEVALFTGLMYVTWSWKMFIGMVSDAFPIKWRGRLYRRLPWFLLSGILTTGASIPFLFQDPVNMPVWTVFFPAITLILSADCILDLAADTYVMDVCPPEWHAKVLGGVAFAARSIGGVMAVTVPLMLIAIGGYRLVFLTSGFVGMLAFPCLLLKEPKLEKERVFSKRAIAFTFTEKTIPIMCIFDLGIALSPRAFASPIGGMFTLIAREVIGVSPESIAKFSLVALLAGVPGALIGGWAADKWGHRRMFIIAHGIFAIVGILWATLKFGMYSWFATVAIISGFMENFRSGSNMGVMADMTPIGLTSTVSQMYSSFVWIGGIIASAIVGILLPKSLVLCIVVVSLLSGISLLAVQFVKKPARAKPIDL